MERVRAVITRGRRSIDGGDAVDEDTRDDGDEP